jgi:hypothetical protein
MTAIRAAALGGGLGSASGAIVGGGIAQFVAGPGTLGVVWLAAVVGAVVSGVVSALVVRAGASNSESTAAAAGHHSR